MSLASVLVIADLSRREPVHEDKNLARYLVDHLMRQRHIKTAKAVTESAGVEVCQPITML